MKLNTVTDVTGDLGMPESWDPFYLESDHIKKDAIVRSKDRPNQSFRAANLKLDRTETYFYGHAKSRCEKLKNYPKPVDVTKLYKMRYTCFNDGSRLFLLCDESESPSSQSNNICKVSKVSSTVGNPIFNRCIDVSSSKADVFDDTENWGAYLLDSFGREHFPAGMEASRRSMYGDEAVACSDVPPRPTSGQGVVAWAFVIIVSVVLFLVAGVVVFNLARQ